MLCLKDLSLDFFFLFVFPFSVQIVWTNAEAVLQPSTDFHRDPAQLALLVPRLIKVSGGFPSFRICWFPFLLLFCYFVWLLLAQALEDILQDIACFPSLKQLQWQHKTYTGSNKGELQLAVCDECKTTCFLVVASVSVRVLNLVRVADLADRYIYIFFLAITEGSERFVSHVR